MNRSGVLHAWACSDFLASTVITSMEPQVNRNSGRACIHKRVLACWGLHLTRNSVAEARSLRNVHANPKRLPRDKKGLIKRPTKTVNRYKGPLRPDRPDL